MKHILSLEVPDTANSQIFRIIDTSQYASDLAVVYPLLTITSPGFTAPVVIEPIEDFNLVLNSCSLGVQLTNCEEILAPLADGLYHIRYAVSPHDSVYVEYKHLRVVCILNKYYHALSQIEIEGCSPDECTRQQLKELRLIKSFIDAAKAKVEYSHKCEEGLELLSCAQKKLKAYDEFCCK